MQRTWKMIVTGANKEFVDVEHKKERKKLRAEYEEKIKELKADFDIERQELRTANETEINGYEENYKERCNRNDELRHDAVTQLNNARDAARECEDYWRIQNGKINEFLAATVAAIRTIAERYEFLQGSLSKVQVGKDMIDDLNKAYKSLINDAHKNSPSILGEENFNNNKK